MKKSIFSLVTAGLLIGALSTSAMAREEVTVGVLTKATTKLIKENRDLSQNVLQTQASQEALTNKVEEQKVFIKNVADENSKTNEKINLAEQNNKKTETLAKDNLSKINDLYKYKEVSSKDLQILNNNLKELSKKVGFTENTLSKVTATYSATQKETSNVSSSSLEKIEQQIASIQLENKNLKDSLSSLKSSTDNEIKGLKSKLEKSSSSQKEHTCSKSCHSNNSSDNSSESVESNEIINNFIK